MAQPVQHQNLRVVVFDRRGELLPRAKWPEYARRYQQDQPDAWFAAVARDGGPPSIAHLEVASLALEWEPPPCDTEPRE